MITYSHRKGMVDAVDVTHDVTGWRQIRHSIFMFKWDGHIYHDTDLSFSPIITNLDPYRKNGSPHRPVIYLGQKSNN